MSNVNYTVVVTETRKRRVVVPIDVPDGANSGSSEFRGQARDVAAADDGDDWGEPVTSTDVLYWQSGRLGDRRVDVLGAAFLAEEGVS